MSIRGEHRTSTFNPIKDSSSILHFFNDVHHFDVNVDLVEKYMIAWVKYYASYEEEQLWRQLSTACGDNYELFRKEVLSFYLNVASRYNLDDLIALIQTNASVLMINIVALEEYHRNYLRISRYLVHIHHISKLDQKRYFRDEIHPILNEQLDQALRFVDYAYLIDVSWDINVVMRELKRILSRGQIQTSTSPNSRTNYTYSIDRNSYYSPSTWSNSSFKYLDVDVSAYADPSAHIVPKEEDKFALIMNELRQLKEVNNRQSRSPPLERDAPRGRESRNFDRCSMCEESRHIMKNCSTCN